MINTLNTWILTLATIWAHNENPNFRIDVQMSQFCRNVMMSIRFQSDLSADYSGLVCYSVKWRSNHFFQWHSWCFLWYLRYQYRFTLFLGLCIVESYLSIIIFLCSIALIKDDRHRGQHIMSNLYPGMYTYKILVTPFAKLGWLSSQHG